MCIPIKGMYLKDSGPLYLAWKRQRLFLQTIGYLRQHQYLKKKKKIVKQCNPSSISNLLRGFEPWTIFWICHFFGAIKFLTGAWDLPSGKLKKNRLLFNLRRFFDFGPMANKRCQSILQSIKFEFPAHKRKQLIHIFCSGE